MPLNEQCTILRPDPLDCNLNTIKLSFASLIVATSVLLTACNNPKTRNEQIAKFRTDQPGESAKYIQLSEANLELYRALSRVPLFNVTAHAEQLKRKWDGNLELAAFADHMIEVEEKLSKDTLEAFDVLEKAAARGGMICHFTYLKDTTNTESGFLVLKNGAIVKRYSWVVGTLESK